MSSFPSEVAIYVGRIRQFERIDWAVYAGWFGLMLGLVLSTGGFLLFGRSHGVSYPAEAWMVPLGALVFAASISIDTIGHRTVYRDEISKAEGLVHGITIFAGIGSTVLLCAAYHAPKALWIPAMVLTVLSFFYSVVDEVFHWRRYAGRQADRVEMWSHVGILVGHGTMMIGWWSWFFAGYPGVQETVAAFSGA
ncbi:MAG: hypothetical protein IPI67_27850 [Myxococcales bacterium]|nr:hypothetical protein [Myxococcales bacterium]